MPYTFRRSLANHVSKVWTSVIATTPAKSSSAPMRYKNTMQQQARPVAQQAAAPPLPLAIVSNRRLR